MKKYYELVVSILDKDGNRVDAIEITGAHVKKELHKERVKLRKRISDGEFNECADFENGESLVADIEVHDDESYELLWVE